MYFRKLPPQEVLTTLFSYGERNGTGYLSYKKGPKAGLILGWVNVDSNGKSYVRMHVPGYGTYYLNRLIFAYQHGSVGAGLVIDHINENSLDNRLANLQQLTPSQNIVKAAKLKNFNDCQLDLFA